MRDDFTPGSCSDKPLETRFILLQLNYTFQSSVCIMINGYRSHLSSHRTDPAQSHAPGQEAPCTSYLGYLHSVQDTVSDQATYIKIASNGQQQGYILCIPVIFAVNTLTFARCIAEVDNFTDEKDQTSQWSMVFVSPP